MEAMIDSVTFSMVGSYVMYCLLFLACLLGVSGIVNLLSPRPVFKKVSLYIFTLANLLFLAGFVLICWFHYQIYCDLPLELPGNLATFLNSQLTSMNRGAEYGLPLLDPVNPPRYTVPVWIENEKYYFWFMCFGIMALFAHLRLRNHRVRALLYTIFAVQVGILYFATDPFANPLPGFFAEITPWFEGNLHPRSRFGLFMKLYPRMVFYYNASYMWVHPPMLFISYACITLIFVTSLFMLVKRDPVIEIAGYDFAKLGFLMLTIGMLVGYPWALQAWGPNWWWDPKICSSIMMWSVFSTYLHTRLYAGRTGMWYFTSVLGILCFLAMIFTFLTSIYFPGEHTSQ